MNDTAPTPSRVRLVQVGAEEAGQRIDNFLARHLKGVPKSHLYRILRKGEVRVNKGRVKPDYKVAAGDTVRIPPLRVGEADPDRPAPTPGSGARLEGAILHEDAGLLIVDKPAGMAVHGGSGVSYGVIEALRAARPTAPFLELGHRLDRDTSGCLVIAKKRSALRHLHEALRSGRVDKRYLALVQGAWRGAERTVELALRKNTLQGGERVVRVDAAEGKPAKTRFRPLQRFAEATLVEAELFTGRTHQIRVHAAAIGHPLAGDEKYGDAAFNKRLQGIGLRRLFLHAQRLTLPLPDGGELTVSAPLPEELRRVVDRLE